MASQTLTLCFTKEQENEAGPLRARPSGSEFFSKTIITCMGLAVTHLLPPGLSPGDDSSIISSLDHSPRPDASVHPLPPHLTLGLTGPGYAAPHTQEATPPFQVADPRQLG